MHDMRNQPPSAFPNVSPRWLLGAAGLVGIAALACAWLVLCLLYWQGSWQLLYHPRAAIVRTPAVLDIPFEQVSFAANETGKTQLTGWWIPAEQPSLGSPQRFTMLYFHGANGNLSDTVDALAAMHAQSIPVFAVDYRGYGESEVLLTHGHPSEKQLRQDAEWSLTWMTLTRHIQPANILVYGSGLGANLAAELAADHSEIAGLILDDPKQEPLAPIFKDSRSRLVPAHWLVSDRYDLSATAKRLQVPSLWLMPRPHLPQTPTLPTAYQADRSRKSAAWLADPSESDAHFHETLKRWIDDL
jgi:pimeloyl-ACP methyl ester carboxylesterase